MSRFALLSVVVVVAIVAFIALSLPPDVYPQGEPATATEPAMTFQPPTSVPLRTPTPEPAVCKGQDDCPGPPPLLTATSSPTPRIVICGKEPCEGTPPPMITGTPTPGPAPDGEYRVFLPWLANCSECLSIWEPLP